MNYILGFVSGILIVLVGDSFKIFNTFEPIPLNDKIFISLLLMSAIVFIVGSAYTTWKNNQS